MHWDLKVGFVGRKHSVLFRGSIEVAGLVVDSDE